MPSQALDCLLHNPQPSLRIGMLGIGVVGGGTLRLLQRNHALIRAHAGRNIELTQLCARNLVRAREQTGDAVYLTADPHELVCHPEIDVVVELIGGTTLAKDLVLQAIACKKHVVTANKALLAEHGEEIFAAARRHGVMLGFEGAVAVSIPIVKTLREGLAANRIDYLAGIVNGTSNFILSRMQAQGCSFDEALQAAQQQGFAEADPSFDVDGIDAGHKLTLLASLAFGLPLHFASTPIQGIRDIDQRDLGFASQLGYAIKLLALAQRTPNGIAIGVHPALIPKDSWLSQVNGSMNGILINSDAAGPSFFYGAGAGAEQTASAVLADLIEVARLQGAAPAHTAPPLGFHIAARQSQNIYPASELPCPYFLRLDLEKREQAASILPLLQQCGLDVTASLLDASETASGCTFAGISTHASHAQLITAIAQLNLLPGISGQISHWRVEGLPTV